MKKIDYIVRFGELEAEMLLGTYPIVNLVMRKKREIDGKNVWFRYTLTFGFDFVHPEICIIPIGELEAEMPLESALELMFGKIVNADISETSLYPNKIDGWMCFEGIYYNNGTIANYPHSELKID
jgi:hypothetical protein